MPLERAEPREGLGVEPGHDGHVGVARPSAAALGEEHDGEAQALDELEEPILLAVVHLALGAGQDGIVVRQNRATRSFLVEEVAVDLADARHEAVGRRVRHEVLGAPARPLRCDDEAAVFLEAAWIAQVLDVLPGRPPPAVVPALGGRRTTPVKRAGDAGAQLGELGTHATARRGDRVPIGAGLFRGRCRGPLGTRGRRLVLVDQEQHIPGLDRVRRRHGHGAHHPGRSGLDDVLHLHGFEHDENGPRLDLVPGADLHAEHGAGEGHRELGQPSHRGSGTSKPTSVAQVLR